MSAISCTWYSLYLWKFYSSVLCTKRIIICYRRERIIYWCHSYALKTG